MSYPLAMPIRHSLLALAIWVVTSSVSATDGQNYFQVLYDTSQPISSAYQTDLGYAVYIAYDGVKMLMDTGDKAEILENNLRAAGIDVADLDLIAVSHNHHDHAGGLSYTRRVAPQVAVYAPPGQALDDGEVRRVQDHLAITPNLFLMRTHTPSPNAGIANELSLLIKTADGPYLITACSHTGLKRIFDKATRLVGADIVYYTGGAHLASGPLEDAKDTAKRLKARGVSHVSPSHCNLSHAVTEVFKSEFEHGYVAPRLGLKVLLPGTERPTP